MVVRQYQMLNKRRIQDEKRQIRVLLKLFKKKQRFIKLIEDNDMADLKKY